MKITEPLFIPAIHKFGLSTSTIWDSMERDITYVVQIIPDWDAIPESFDAGVIIRNGKHTGVQVSHENGVAFAKGIVWTKVGSEEIPTVNAISLGEISKIKGEYINLVFHHSHKRKEIGLIVGFKDWTNPFTIKMNYEGDVVDYTDSWLWIGCCLGLVNDEDIMGKFHGEIKLAAAFQREFNDRDFLKMFPSNEEPDFTYENYYKLWSYKHPIFYCDFKDRTPYKFKDLSGNGNNLCVYREEWGDMF